MTRPTLLARLIEMGYAERIAQAYVLDGRVRVNGEVWRRPRQPLPAQSEVTVSEPSPYPSRSAHKLKGALATLGLDIRGRVCVDLGAAHGGFTAVLLEAGAAHVYAIDVAYGMLDFRLRQDSRVTVLERRNARELTPAWFDEVHRELPAPWFITADLAFISLRSILPALGNLAQDLSGGLEALLLVKPQFEDSTATEGGVIVDDAQRAELVSRVAAAARDAGFRVLASLDSPLAGRRGNREVFVLMELSSA